MCNVIWRLLERRQSTARVQIITYTRLFGLYDEHIRTINIKL